jgi:ABC-type transport system involved in multi-copper enzyme maturation permease subunit
MVSDYWKREAGDAFRPHHLAVLAGCMAVTAATSLLMPGMPDAVYRFFIRVFAMNNWTEIILINDYMGVFFALFWVGVIDLIRVYVQPKEEGYLGILLSKPLDRTQYLFAKVLSSFGVIAGMGAALSLFLPLKIALINGTADLHPGGIVCAGVVTTAAVLALLALLNLVFLFAQETYYAVLLSFLVFALVVLPAGVFTYRPDVFQGRAMLRVITVFPVNLIWLSEGLPKITPILVLLAVAAGALLLTGSGWRLRRMDIE